MATALMATQALSNPDTQKFVLALLDSGASLAFMAWAFKNIDWILEHVEVRYNRYERKWKIYWLSTAETSNMSRVGLAPPYQSTAIRLLDAGADTAEAAANLAAQSIQNTQKKGLLPALWEGLTGGG